MTRINVVSPRELCDQHLLAEYRELPRVFGLAIRAFKCGMPILSPAIPTTYRLSTGHVLFFYNKLQFLAHRYERLVDELRARSVQTQWVDIGDSIINQCPVEWYNDWTPRRIDYETNWRRIRERLRTMQPRYTQRGRSV